jgi:hypothetical protein
MEIHSTPCYYYYYYNLFSLLEGIAVFYPIGNNTPSLTWHPLIEEWLLFHLLVSQKTSEYEQSVSSWIHHYSPS